MSLLAHVLLSMLGAALWLFLGGLFAWGYYSVGAAHYVALMLALPVSAAAAMGVPESAVLGVAFGLAFLAFLAILRGVVLIRGKREHAA